MYDPEGTDSGHTDWIELYNSNSSEIVIQKAAFGLIDEPVLEMGSDGVHYRNCHGIASDLSIGPGEFVVLADKASDFVADYPDSSALVIDSTFSLSSMGDTLRLSRDKCATFFLELEYDDSWGASDNGRTLEKKDTSANYGQSRWQESYLKGGTPGRDTSKKPDPKSYPLGVAVNEIFPNPEEDEEENEFIEIFNDSKETVDLSGWRLKDSSASDGYVFPEGTKIGAGDYSAVYRSAFKFALNNSGEEGAKLYDPEGKLVSSAAFDGARENLSFGFDGKKWRWSSSLTPGKKNIFGEEPDGQVKRDKEVYKKMAANFDVKLKKYDKKKTKITWDFGDGHKSYKKKTTHKYEKKGKYQASVKIFNGSEEVLEKFEVKVKDFPEYDVDIISLVPNPKGSDTELETITLKNDTKKEINLRNWSLATGGKKLVNHPIREDLYLGPKETLVVSRKFSKFSLNNKKGKVELRYPTGKTADKVKYDRGGKGAKEGEAFEETEKGWIWKNISTPVIPWEAKDLDAAPIIIENPELTEEAAELLIKEEKNYHEEFSLWIIDRSIFQETGLQRTETEKADLLKALYLLGEGMEA